MTEEEVVKLVHPGAYAAEHSISKFGLRCPIHIQDSNGDTHIISTYGWDSAMVGVFRSFECKLIHYEIADVAELSLRSNENLVDRAFRIITYYKPLLDTLEALKEVKG